MLFIAFVSLKNNHDCDDDMFSSFLLSVSTTTTTKDNYNGFWNDKQANTTTTKQSKYSDNKKYDVMWNMFNYQTNMIDDDNDDSSSINNDCFQFTMSLCMGDDEMSTHYNKLQATFRKKMMINFQI